MSDPTTTVDKLKPYLDSIPYVDNSNIRAGEFGNPLVLSKLFFLLTLMINSLQNTAAAQAKRLNFLTAWQNAYAAKMNQMHVFVAGNKDNTSNNADPLYNISVNNTDPSTAASAGAKASTIRGDLNTLNTGYSQRLQSLNGVVSNDAKALQSAVNQTNDAVQSQSDMATGVLQQLQTILTSIYQNAA